MLKNKKRQSGGAEKISLHPEAKKSLLAVIMFGLAVIFIVSATTQAGPWGSKFYDFFDKLFGWGYYLLPAVAFISALSFLTPEEKKIWGPTLIGGFLFIISGLGFIDIIAPGKSGIIGVGIGSLKYPLGSLIAVIIMLTALLASLIVIVNRPLKLNFFSKKDGEKEKDGEVKEEKLEIKLPLESHENIPSAPPRKEKISGEKQETKIEPAKVAAPKPIKNYVPPPLNLLVSTIEKPTIGDLRANANIIKRTLESFGIPVEMGEINVGPTVTRYTLKPAEGVKLSRITALNQDLALALAAHPIRIEAPIPGKSLVGIEVPNKAAAVVRLGSILLYPDFQKNGSLSFAIGRNVQGEPIFADIAKMPHLLIAGATGSGKSVMIHSLLISLLYKNSPEMLRLIIIDPKRVELSIYDGIPHLLSPVITNTKKSVGVLKWAIQEMDRRYEILLEAGVRDIKTYNKNGYKMPCILIVIDELADLMTSYGREVEGSIIRLAQMSRATGIHLAVSTQRPSVEIITGLIKANITTRIALQVASQVDSRTILDTSGAEKLLGSGDSLYTSAELSKPQRIQGAYLTEDEIKKVIGFIKNNNEAPSEETSFSEPNSEKETSSLNFDDFGESDADDELYEEAVETVRTAKKASASLLQRRLKVGYARAARLLDIMEEKGIVGPGDGAKPREVYE